MTIPAPREASTLCLLRPGGAEPEVLLVRRSAASRFMGGSYVFPGGAVHDLDRSDLAHRAVAADPDELPWMAAALRETAEEAGVWLTRPGPDPADVARWRGLTDADLYQEVIAGGYRFDGARLGLFARWITPTMVPIRFDTKFFVARAEPGTAAEPDGFEVDDAVWVSCREALRRDDHGSWHLPFPTRKTVEHLARFADPEAALEHSRTVEVVPIRPRIATRPDGTFTVRLPGDPGFEDLEEEPPPPGLDPADLTD